MIIPTSPGTRACAYTTMAWNTEASRATMGNRREANDPKGVLHARDES
ncbi:hypothetical protein [Pseudomonas sp. S1_E04]